MAPKSSISVSARNAPAIALRLASRSRPRSTTCRSAGVSIAVFGEVTLARSASRTYLLRETFARPAGQDTDQLFRLVGDRIAAPCYMLVGSDNNEVAIVGRLRTVGVDVDDFDRDPVFAHRLHQRCDRYVPIESEQRVARSKGIGDWAAVRQFRARHPAS